MSPRKPYDPAERRPLSPREMEIARLVARGKSTKEVAVMLCISVKTAQTHRTNLMRKLELHNVVELVLWALRTNLTSLEEQAA